MWATLGTKALPITYVTVSDATVTCERDTVTYTRGPRACLESRSSAGVRVGVVGLGLGWRAAVLGWVAAKDGFGRGVGSGVGLGFGVVVGRVVALR